MARLKVNLDFIIKYGNLRNTEVSMWYYLCLKFLHINLLYNSGLVFINHIVSLLEIKLIS